MAAKVKVPSAENSELSKILAFKAWIRSDNSFVCFGYCQERRPFKAWSRSDDSLVFLAYCQEFRLSTFCIQLHLPNLFETECHGF